jgi:hypothetical protein
LFQNYPKHPFVVRSPVIRADRLSLTHPASRVRRLRHAVRNPSLTSTSSTTTAPPARPRGHTRRNANSTFSVVCRLSRMHRSIGMMVSSNAGSRRRLDPRINVQSVRSASGTATPISWWSSGCSNGGTSTLHRRPPPLRCRASSTNREVTPCATPVSTTWLAEKGGGSGTRSPARNPGGHHSSRNSSLGRFFTRGSPSRREPAPRGARMWG